MPAAAPQTRPRPRDRIGLWLRAARIRQWTKNLLVFGAPAAAGALGRPGVLWRASLATAAFCVLSSGVYFNQRRP